MDNLSLYPPGVGPQDDFDFPNSGKSKFYKDPRLSNQFEKPAEKEIKRSTVSPSRPKHSEERYEKRDRSVDRSPKRSRDRYSDRYDREDSYERRSSHRSRRTPSSTSPQSKRSRQSRDSQQYDRRSYRDKSDNQFVDRSQIYSSNNYQTQYPQAPQGYGNQVPQFPAYMGSSTNDNFMPNSYMSSNYIAPAATHPPPPNLMGSIMGAPPPPETTDGQWPVIPPTSQTLPVQPAADKIKREAAIASEKRQQRVTLLKQRDQYLRKVNNLKRELKVLKDQRNQLKGSSRTPPSPDTYRFLKENSKLQVEISEKLKTMNDVIEMLSGIIGDDEGESTTEKRKSAARSPTMASPEQSSKNGDHSFSSDRSSKQTYNYIHYDPEMHWCQICNMFPKTAKEYLQHLHDPEHLLNMETGPGLEAPWHQILTEEDEEPPTISGAATKRLPIRGLQHFIASPAWFCKLCSKWIGDLHCASAHLKSKGHAKSYARFTEQNPHWETDWMADRQKAYERSCNINPDKMNQSNESAAADVSEGKSKKKHSKKEKKNKKKSKKHKKSKTSSSETSTESESDSSGKLSEDKASSIRVAMRNKLKQAEMIMQEKIANSGKWSSDKIDEKSTKKTESPQKPERDDKMLMQWMANKGVLTESDKKMFEALRMRLKHRQEAEANKAEFKKVTPQPSVIPLIREQAEAAAKKQREAEAEAEALKEREKYEAERENERRERERREREKEKDREYYKDREPRSYYRDRRRSPEYRNRYYDKRYSRSPDRDRRHYRSRSPEYRSRVEVGVIVNPPPAPKPSKYEKKKYKNTDADSSDEKEKAKLKQLQQQQKEQQQSNKKLPFIGRMPVFKAKQKDDSPKNDDDKKTGLEKAIQKRDEINAQIKKAMEDGTIQPSLNMSSGFMDPDQMYADMAPPPPNISYEDPPIGFVTQQELPPGIESPSALDEIKIPINAAPPNKELPKDFADALDIIFPGDKKPGSDILIAPVAPPPPMDVMPMMVPPYTMDTQQYSDYTFALPATGYESAMPEHQPQPQPEPDLSEQQPPEETTETIQEEKKEHPEMDDLAMLGIDESDITAQHF